MYINKKILSLQKIACILIVSMIVNSFAAVVSDNDGSAFITKAEFDSLKNNFQTQINQYNISIDNKIDIAIAAYLAGIKISNKINLPIEALKKFNFPLTIGQPDALWTPGNRHSFELKNYYAHILRNTYKSGSTNYNKPNYTRGNFWKVVSDERGRVPIYVTQLKNSKGIIQGMYYDKISLESAVSNANWSNADDSGEVKMTASPDAYGAWNQYGLAMENLAGNYFKKWTDSYSDDKVYLDNRGFVIDMCMYGRHDWRVVTSSIGHSYDSKGSSGLSGFFSWQGQSSSINKINAMNNLSTKFNYVGDYWDNYVLCIDTAYPYFRIGWNTAAITSTFDSRDYETNKSAMVTSGSSEYFKLVNASIPDVWPMCKSNYTSYTSFRNDTESAIIKPEYINYTIFDGIAKQESTVPLTSGLPIGYSTKKGELSIIIDVDMLGEWSESQSKYLKTKGIEVFFSKKPFKSYVPDKKDLLSTYYDKIASTSHIIKPDDNGKYTYNFTIKNYKENDQLWMLINKMGENDQAVLDKISEFAVTTTDD